MIIDDELAMLTVMQRLLHKIEGIEVVGSFQHMKDALRFTQKELVDIAFIDIMIADESGLELARQLRAEQAHLEIVFVTSHREYAVDAFDTYPLDYMVKPVSQKRLAQTLERAKVKKRKSVSEPIKTDSNQLIVKTLGGLEVSSSVAGEVKFISKKSQELFALLLLQRGRTISKDKVMDEMFAEMPLENAVGYLHTIVYQLRKALKSHGLKSIVRSFDEQYLLEIDRIEADFIAFESYVNSKEEWNETTVRKAIEWETRFAGDLYEGKAYPWSVLEQEALAIQYHDFAVRLVRWLLEHKQVTQAILIAKKLVSRNELDTEANALLLQAYHLAKDNISFQKHYQRFSKLYQQEIGDSPSIEGVEYEHERKPL
ncbi:response regulator [Gracilibacillus alcaliphilus]|uniref:response regulator n=1 Tax=Gracilibacillus alcaliphilus TaxID=1401441 RepID=UPI001EF7858B|nr:response regulator [Gracilibacillus alcaliphilus]